MKLESSIPDGIIPVAARLAGCRAEELLSMRVTDEGGLVVIAPSGKKLTFSAAEVSIARANASGEALKDSSARSAGRSRGRP